MQSTLTKMATHFGRMDERLTKMETVFARGGHGAPVKPDPAGDDEGKSQQHSPEVTSAGRAEPFYPPDLSRDATVSSDVPHPLDLMAEDELEGEPGPLVPPGEPAIPINHTTLAGLLLEWPAIRELTRHHIEKAGVRYIGEFPIGQEQSRGPLIVHGRGEGAHPYRHGREHQEPGSLDTPDDSSDIASPSPVADFGQLAGPSPPDFEYKGGVLGTEGSPDLSESTVWRYVQMFKDHILSMHPIIQPRVLDGWVRYFLDTLPTTQHRSAKAQSAKFAFAVPPNSQVPAEPPGSKRKRSVELAESKGPATTAPGRAGRPDRSIHSALVLTILALGKICSHRGFVPDVASITDSQATGGRASRNGVPASPGHSPPPAYSSVSHSAHPSPGDANTDRASQGSRSSVYGGAGSRPISSLKKNYEVIPGLEYFAYATDILGNFTGAYNSLKDVYANIFACLYYGQLNRPLESFAYIHKAGHKLQVIMRP